MPYVLEIVVPATGEPIDKARLVGWGVQPGQSFRSGDVLLEIETDKSVIEVPAGRDGMLLEHLVAVDGLLDADTPIARIRVEGDAPAAADADGSVPPESLPAEAAGPPVPPVTAQDADRPPAAAAERRFATPRARAAAGELGLRIESVVGSGPAGRATLVDVEQAAALRPAPGATAAGTRAAAIRTGKRDSMLSTSIGDVRVASWESAPQALGPATLVLVHGLFGDLDTWGSVAHTLARSGVRVVAMDLPCHGRSKSEAIDIAQIVDAIDEVVARECAGPIVLVGHSFGGAIAARLAGRPNRQIEALILIAPIGMGTEIDQSFLDGMAYGDSVQALGRELAKLTVTGMTPSPGYVEELRAAIRGRRERLVELCRTVSWNGVQQIDVVRDLASLRCPVVLIHGRRDRIVPWQHALNAPPRVALHLLPEAGHMPQWEASAVVQDIVSETMAR